MIVLHVVASRRWGWGMLVGVFLIFVLRWALFTLKMKFRSKEVHLTTSFSRIFYCSPDVRESLLTNLGHIRQIIDASFWVKTSLDEPKVVQSIWKWNFAARRYILTPDFKGFTIACLMHEKACWQIWDTFVTLSDQEFSTLRFEISEIGGCLTLYSQCWKTRIGKFQKMSYKN